MQCILKKENTDDNCDGGSEHCEAIAVAIDAILLHHLSNNKDAPFDGAIRTKATLVSGSLLEDRGFEEVATLSRDMATHTSSLDACLCKYADRAVTTSARSPGARERAIQITSLLGTIDRTNDLKSNATEEEAASNDEDDPWAGIKQFI
eukprot:CAMPEP_0202473802 /NCGR_PEP_ID=MMETSP1360-20130828/92029_1 /ASSEMBLY_ACC=CAM_ASM_000848 /TAXON_ID=515479 /ORGANISM="Licmophora paradoxa, Strain CCMP2313" /LENGTH=148 /DNA_ID=CAMNT_0049100863 /DNA_START=69 /DNA_END=515 /DNA_ORIENTATION=-